MRSILPKRVPWNKGYTKHTHPSVLKVAQTLRRKPKSNFYQWQLKNKVQYHLLEKNEDLAEFYGLLLGDGCIERLSRCEKVSISCNKREEVRISRIKRMMTKIFRKEAKLRYRKTSRCVDVYFYQKHLSKRLRFPVGEKLKHRLSIPLWICANPVYTVRCLKGLFESDGDRVVDLENYTDVIKFTNFSPSLLEQIYRILKNFGFHPQLRHHDVRLARKLEVKEFVHLIRFSKL
ncbi:MAG: LAGLIDADG family homing endonuclease [Chlamydiae bacterium]|nr:LAGLIDADG family homing endonuclease [Chlamydiota bacterium]MBI3276810.1 LAGLIDADG family homing endonuclease [Chlamydiota bacterium]